MVTNAFYQCSLHVIIVLNLKSAQYQSLLKGALQSQDANIKSHTKAYTFAAMSPKRESHCNASSSLRKDEAEQMLTIICTE